MTPPSPSVPDLSACESEPIRFPGAVQPHGALLVVDPASGAVLAASESSLALLGIPASDLLGLPSQAVLGGLTVQSLSASADGAQPTLPVLPVGNRRCTLRAATNDQGLVLVDVEAAGPDDALAERALRIEMGPMRRLGDVAGIAGQACAAVRRVLGFDRVMVYRFDDDWNGEVIGEACADATEPYLGLHYPASDIPRQSREIYRLCAVRHIPDVGYVPSALVTLPGVAPIDLGRSALRSVSPVHTAYCRNMGVQASLVGSLVIDDRLWGLVACHHSAGPMTVAVDVREAFGAFCDNLAGVLDAHLLREQKARTHDLAARRRALVGTIRAHDFRTLIRRRDGQELLDVVGADGFALLVNGSTELIGHTPETGTVRQLDALRRARAPETPLYATDALQADLGPLPGAGDVAGALFVSVPHKPSVTMIWFRTERAQHVRWGGDPNHPHTLQADGRISPRAPFNQFLQAVQGRSLPWSPEELASASELGTLIEIDALREREAFSQTVLDSIPSQCEVDDAGAIVTVDRAWEQRYLAVLEGQTDLICRFRIDGTILYVNPAYCRFFGKSADELVGRTWQPVAVVDDLPMINAAIAGLSPGNPVVTIENRVHAAGGEVRWGQFVNRAFFDEQGRLVEVQVVARDITERKLGEARADALLREQRALLNSPVVGIVKVADQTVAWANPAFAAMFGYSVDEVIGRPTRVFFESDAVHETFVAASTAAMDGGVVFQSEARQRRKDGSWGWFAVSMALLDTSTRERIGALVDISARKAAEDELERYRNSLEALVAARTQALQQAKEVAEAATLDLQKALDQIVLGNSTLDAALQSMSDAVFISDVEGRFIHFNDAFASFHRFADKASCASSLAEYPAFLDVFLPNGEKAALENWAVPRALRGESASNVEFTLRRRDTGQSWIGSYNYAPIRGQDGRIVGTVVTARDVTHSKQEELALTLAKEAAEAASRAKSTFLATMSHELRTPLNGIMGMIELATRRAVDPRQADQLGKAAKASRHLLEIIRDILDISRIEASRFVLQETEFQLDGVFQNLDALIHEQIASKSLTLSMDLAPELQGRVVHGDARRLSQILLNLTGNAAKFTAAGSITVRARLVSDDRSGVVLRFEVQDTGIGVAPQDQQRIFLDFEQADSSNTRAYGGSGLGLAISRRLVTMMGGTLGVDSQAGAGATFWFTARLGRSRPAAEHDVAVTQPSARALLQSRHAGAHVLLVDDDEMNLEVSQGLLEDCGLIVHATSDGAQAVERARRVNYDLILMDIQMPSMDGIEATRQIRRLPNNPDVPIIAFTANVFPEDEARCREAGMTGFIGRPVESEALYAAMLEGLDRSRAGDA